MRKALFAAITLLFGLSVSAAILYGYANARIKKDPLVRSPVRFQGSYPIEEDPEIGFVSTRDGVSVRHDLFSGNSYHLFHDKRSARVSEPGQQTQSPVDLMTVGCSFSYGYGLENEDSYTSLIGEDLGLRVVNLSLGSYGSVQSLQLMQRNMDLKPKLVVYGYIADHLRRNLSPCAPSYLPYCLAISYLDVKQDGAVSVHPPARGFPLSTLRDYSSRIVQRSTDRVDWIDLYWRLRLDLVHLENPEGPEDGPENRYRGLTFAIERMQALAKERGARFLVLYIPQNLKRGQIHGPDEIFLRVMRERNAEFLDASIPAHRFFEANRDSSTLLDFENDGHPNAAAHRLVADQIMEYIGTSGLMAANRGQD